MAPRQTTVSATDLQALVRRHLAAGAPGDPPSRVTWVDHGDEVLLNLGEIDLACRPGAVAVRVPMYTEETKQVHLLVLLALSEGRDGAGLIATTEALPRGDALLAARWGRILQDAIWGALLAAAEAEARQYGLVPWAIIGEAEGVRLVSGEDFHPDPERRCRC